MTKATLSTASARLWRLAVGTELRRNVVETYGTRVLVAAAGFGTAIVISRGLGPTGRGFYAVAVTIGALGVQFSNLGLHASNMYYVAKDRALLPTLVGNMLAVVLVTGALMILGGIGFAVWPKVAPIHGTLLVLAMASIPVGLAYLLTQGLLLGINEVRAYNKIESIGKILILLLICIPALVRRGSVELFFGITLASSLLTFLWALLRLRRVSARRPVVSWAVFRQSIGIGLRAYTIAFFGFLLLRIDLLMVKYMLGASEAGYYSISQVLAENTMMFPVIVGLLLFPKLSATKSREEKLQLTNKAVLATAALMLPVVVVAAVAAGPVISLAFGVKFLPAVLPFIWLMPGTFFLGVETVMVQILNSEGFPPAILLAWIADTILNVALNFWTIPHYGILGASVLSSICYFFMFAFVGAVLWKRFYARYPVAYAPQPEPM
jgi:O-antigen/teichoic acid export membrane protein